MGDKRLIWTGAGIVLLLALLFGYHAFRILNGNPVSNPEAVKVAERYLDHTYPDEHFEVTGSTYDITTGEYQLDAKNSDGSRRFHVNVDRSLKVLDDENGAAAYSEQLHTYLLTQSVVPLEQAEAIVSATRLNTAQFARRDKIWLQLSGKTLDAKGLADFMKTLLEQAKRFGMEPEALSVDYENTAAGERLRMDVPEKNLNDRDFTAFIHRIKSKGK